MDNLEFLSDYTKFLREKKEEGKKIIAFISHDNIPEELFDAAGFIPLRLIFAGNDELQDASHDYLPPSTCAFAQSCIGLFSLKPNHYRFRFLELIDYFVVSNHCVSDICTSEIISKYFNIPRLNFYVSYTTTANSLKYFKLELKDLKDQLEEITGIQIKDEDILASIKKYNDFKKKLVEFNDLEIKGSVKLKMIQKAILFGPEILTELEDSIMQFQENQTKNNTKDIILTGCSIFINDFLIDLIEEAGGNIVFFDTWIGSNYFSQVFDDRTLFSIKDPIELLTHRFNHNYSGDHSVPNFLENKISQIMEFYQKYLNQTGKKLGVINHIIKFCDHMSLMSPHLKSRIQEKGVFVLNLERDYSRATRGQLSTRIEAFLEMM